MIYSYKSCTAFVTLTRIRWDLEGEQLSKYGIVVCIRPHPWWDTKFWIRLANEVCIVADFPGHWRSRHKQWTYKVICISAAKEREEGCEDQWRLVWMSPLGQTVQGRGHWLVLRWDRRISGAQVVAFKLPGRLRQEKYSLRSTLATDGVQGQAE